MILFASNSFADGAVAPAFSVPTLPHSTPSNDNTPSLPEGLVAKLISAAQNHMLDFDNNTFNDFFSYMSNNTNFAPDGLGIESVDNPCTTFGAQAKVSTYANCGANDEDEDDTGYSAPSKFTQAGITTIYVEQFNSSLQDKDSRINDGKIEINDSDPDTDPGDEDPRTR